MNLRIRTVGVETSRLRAAHLMAVVIAAVMLVMTILVPASPASAAVQEWCDEVLPEAPPVYGNESRIKIETVYARSYTHVNDVTPLIRMVGDGFDLGPAPAGDPVFDSLPPDMVVVDTSVETVETSATEVPTGETLVVVGCSDNSYLYTGDTPPEKTDPAAWSTFIAQAISLDPAIIRLTNIEYYIKTHHITDTTTYTYGDASLLTGTFHSMTPVRIIDSRSSSQVGPYSSAWGQGTTRDITVAGNAGVPADATGVVLNVTGVTPTAGTYLTIWPKGQSRPTASNLNLPASDIRPNLVMAKLGDSGAVSVYNFLGNTHVVVDVVGWYGSGTDASYFNELSPSRIWDTRPAPENVGPLGKLGQGQTKDLKVTGVGGVPTGATAVVLNVTAVNPSYSTYVTAWPTGQSRPTASNLNAPAGDVRPNLVVAKVGTDGKVSFYNHAGTTDLVVDVVGYFADTGSQFNGMTPKRVWDSRPAPENVGPLGKLGQGQFKSIQVTGTNGVPADAKAVVVNITGVQPSYSTYLTAWPTGEPKPTASNLNLSANTVIPNLAVVKVGSNGKISIYNNAGNTDVVVDIVGWYS